MALSHEVVSQFAKLVDNQPKNDEGVTVKGTYKMIGDIEYVQLDGSNVPSALVLLTNTKYLFL